MFFKENLSRIPYRVYSPTARRPNPNAVLNRKPPQHGSVLRRGEAHARKENYCAYVDYKYAEIWIFDVRLADSSQTPDSATVKPGMQSRFTSEQPGGTPSPAASSHTTHGLDFPLEWGLRKVAEGVFLASGLAPPPPMPPKTPVIDLTLDDDKSEGSAEKITPAVEWTMLVCAVLASVGYNMAKEGRFLPLSLRDFLSLPCPRKPEGDLSEHQFSQFKPNLECVGKMICSLDVHLATSGVLCVAPSTKVARSLGRLADHIDEEQQIEGRDVWIAPWGQVGRVISEVIQQESIDNFALWRSLLEEYLSIRGLDATRNEVGLDGAWAKIAIAREQPDGPPRVENILWPLALLFLREREGDGLLSRTTLESVGYIGTSNDITRLASLHSEEDKQWLPTVFNPADAQYHALVALSENFIEEYSIDHGLAWFPTAGNDPPDPVGFMLNWRDTKLDRDRQILEETHRSVLLQPEDIHEEPVGDQSKPVTVVKTAGVYPTPPEGLTLSHIPSNTGSGPLSSVGIVKESMDLDNQDWLSSANPGKSDDFMGNDTMDDLMGEGEDAFVTDKDFDDFFDEQPMGDMDFGDDFGQPMDAMDIHNEFEPKALDEQVNGGDIHKHEDFETRNRQSMGSIPNGETPTTLQNEGEAAENHIQTPPLSPHRAMALLIPEYTSAATNPHPTPPTTSSADGPSYFNSLEDKRKASLYGPINFNPVVEMADKKYQAGGRYYIPPPPEKDIDELAKSTDIITLGSPVDKKKTPYRRAASHRMNRGADVSVISDPEAMDQEMDSAVFSEEYSSSESDVSDASYESEDPLVAPGGPFTLKRKRSVNDDGEPELVDLTMADDSVEVDISMNVGLPPSEVLLPDPFDASLVDVFDTLSLKRDGSSGLAEIDFISIVTVVAEQLMNSLFIPLRRDRPTAKCEDELSLMIARRKTADEMMVHECMQAIFGTTLKCDLENYTSIADAVLEVPRLGRTTIRPIAPPRRPTGMLSRTPGTPISAGSPTTETAPFLPQAASIQRIPAPHVHVHRGENALEMLPPSLRFWDTFGLTPCSGAKNAISLCIFPSGPVMMDAADGFLDRIGSMYDSCRLGMHVRAKVDIVNNGLVEWVLPFGKREIDERVPAPTTEMAMSILENLCGKLGVGLSRIADERQNIVVYIVNPFFHPMALTDISKAFVKMKKSYHLFMGELKLKPNNLVLQVVPADFIASRDSLVIVDNERAMKMAMEVYNRCTIQESQPSKYYPALRLAKPPPSSIEFRLTNDPSPALLYENSMMHVAYCQSLDERWITAAWTDNWGEIRITKAYCLGRRGTPPTKTFEEIYREIWKQTIEAIKIRNVQWRIVVTKVGALDADDVDGMLLFSLT